MVLLNIAIQGEYDDYGSIENIKIHEGGRMTRINCVPASELTREHLVAEYNEDWEE